MRISIRSAVFHFVLAAAAGAALIAASAPSSAQQPYKVLDHWKLGGEGFWDYLTADPTAQRLYITHGTRVEVINSQTGKREGEITGLHGIHGVALDQSGNFGYISDGGGNAVVVFDRHTLKTVATIPAGTNPDGIVFEPATQTVWAFNGRSKNVTVIDTTMRKVVATIDLPGKPEFPAVDGHGLVFDNIEDKNEIVRLDAHDKTLTATWPIGCDSPSGLAFDTAGHRLFSVCDGKKMAITDSNTGKQLGVATIGDGPDAARYDPKHNLAFVSCGEGVLAVVDAGAAGYPTVETLPTQRGARTMAYDPSTDRVYVVTAELGARPPATKEHPRPRPTIVPGSFSVIVVGR